MIYNKIPTLLIIYHYFTILDFNGPAMVFATWCFAIPCPQDITLGTCLTPCAYSDTSICKIGLPAVKAVTFSHEILHLANHALLPFLSGHNRTEPSGKCH